MTTPEIPPASNTPAVPTAAATPAVITTEKKRSAGPSVIALFLVILGGIALPVGLVGGAITALNAGGHGPGGFIALFVAGLIAVPVGFLIGLVNLIRGPHRVLSFFPVILPLIPVISTIVLINNARH